MSPLLLRVMLVAGLAAVMARAPAIALAQPAQSEAQKKEAAKKLVEEAAASHAAGSYDKAIELYRKAFDLIPHPELMFNIGQAHRLAGRPDKAVQFYERYLQLDPEGREAAAARAHLATIKAAAPAKPPEPKPAEPTPPKPVEVVQPKAIQDGPEVKQAPPPEGARSFRAPEPEPERPEAPAARGGGLRIAGIVIGAAGLACAATGVYFTTRVLDLEDEAAEIAMMGGPLEGVKKRGDAAERNGDIAYVLAGGLFVGSVVTYYLGYRKGRAVPTTALAPVVGPGFAGLAFGGRLP